MMLEMQRIVRMLPSEFKKIITQFKETYPDLVQYGNTYEECDNASAAIIVRIPNKGIVRYESFDNELIWLDRWEDPKEIKRRENEKRPKTYGYFCFVVEQYMKEHNMTQQEFSDMADISRRSLIKYLKGYAIPKVSTMRRICKIINIDI